MPDMNRIRLNGEFAGSPFFGVLKLISGTNGPQAISSGIRLDEMLNEKMIEQNRSICSMKAR